ncbi:MAG: alpha/beta fold hydrolase [Kofleriaceae bacterium]|nr:alpha/beta fold hydrolase [Kofleriaceae bacterium]
MRIALLHGFLGSPEVWNDIAPAPARAVPLPGHGGGPVRATWDANLDAVADEIGACDLVVGYSLGARVALGLVATKRVPRGVLVSVNPGIPDDERAARRASDAAWAAKLRTEGLAAFLAAWEAQPLFATQARVPQALRDARKARRASLDPEQLARSLEVMGLAEMPDYRRYVDARCTLVVGADDAKYVALANALPARVEIIAACGHDPTLEQPRALAAILAAATGT